MRLGRLGRPGGLKAESLPVVLERAYGDIVIVVDSEIAEVSAIRVMHFEGIRDVDPALVEERVVVRTKTKNVLL